MCIQFRRRESCTLDSLHATDRAFCLRLATCELILQKDMGPWQHNIELLLRGVYPSVYPGSVVYRPWSVVDVRDCAAGHIGLLESVTVNSGERYIAWLTKQFVSPIHLSSEP